MWTKTDMLKAARTAKWKRGLSALALLGTPALMAMTPFPAVARTGLDTAPLAAADPASSFFSEYLPFAGSSGTAYHDLLSHALARDLLIGAMLAIAIAMVAGASFLWRENVNHLQKEADRKKRGVLDIF
ncbi:hypothetical protein FF124_08480 [Martelella lutilitoris]|uniref:Uncharacterized protein n=1 Tax=Martelella lutilitoris TaxID=2583532 RepID=A0A5C4JST6_9HYPH|nr:hypothetical protein [Martelella lutilitoris]TNB48357.1 hypothetical protein FF124_08480 [Martelella lutilitoris]